MLGNIIVGEPSADVYWPSTEINVGDRLGNIVKSSLDLYSETVGGIGAGELVGRTGAFVVPSAVVSAFDYNIGVVTNYPWHLLEDADDVKRDRKITIKLGEALDVFLVALNPRLVNLLEGARQALNSNNPERVRHVMTSLRELFTHVLHELAPDDRVREWSNSHRDYDDKGRPTRRARLRYICRGVNKEASTASIGQKVDEALELVQLFHRGTHGLEPQFSLAELNRLGLRMVNTLTYLFEIANGKSKRRN
jgi:hypothetical protein